MIEINAVLVLLVCHWVADFILQTDKMAVNKSKSNEWLMVHCITYTIPFMILSPAFALVNGITHFMIDWCTSRITSKLWANGDRHNFFVCIGMDQFIHVAILILTYSWMVF